MTVGTSCVFIASSQTYQEVRAPDLCKFPPWPEAPWGTRLRMYTLPRNDSGCPTSWGIQGTIAVCSKDCLSHARGSEDSRGVDQKWALKEEQNQATDCSPQTAGATNCTLEKCGLALQDKKGGAVSSQEPVVKFHKICQPVVKLGYF